MKSLYKFLFGMVVVLFCFFSHSVKVEAAEDDSTTPSTVIVPWGDGTREFSMEGYQYYFYAYTWDNDVFYGMFFRSSSPIVGWLYSNGTYGISSKASSFERSFCKYYKELGSFDSTYTKDEVVSSGVLSGWNLPFDLYYTNCDVSHKNTGALLLPSNPIPEVVVELPTVEELFSLLPDELSMYYYCIVFRQDSPQAMDDRILFYGWDDVNANLYINRGNSQICAFRGSSYLKDTTTAYFDLDSRSWVISDDVILGQTKDKSFHLPQIYFCNTDLFYADADWTHTGLIAYMADDEKPGPFVPDDDESDGGFLDFLNPFFSKLKQILSDLFVPSSDYFSKQVNEISSNFGFWTSIRDTANVFIDFLKETDFDEPPTVEIDLSLIKSKVNYGGKAYAFDMRWYEPYKESVDVIIASIMWLVFVWNTYKNLPNIISGVSSGLPATSSLLDNGKE